MDILMKKMYGIICYMQVYKQSCRWKSVFGRYLREVYLNVGWPSGSKIILTVFEFWPHFLKHVGYGNYNVPHADFQTVKTFCIK